jgi:hypothetical protein
VSGWRAEDPKEGKDLKEGGTVIESDVFVCRLATLSCVPVTEV